MTTDEDVKLPNIAALIALAIDGDEVAWGRLYGITAALVRGGRRVPEPLAQIMAERLNTLSRALMSRPKDVRAVLPDAVVPAPGKRVRARRTTAVQVVAEAAADLLQLDDRYGQRKQVVARLAKHHHISERSLNKALDATRTRGDAKED